MKITAVIVTYSNRAEYLSQVVGECLSQGVDKVIIIDNGSPIDNQKQIKAIKTLYTEERIVIHTNKKNEGSAPGFALGIRMAIKQSNNDDWLLVLDDDNKLDTGAVSYLRSLAEDNTYNNAYCCLRSDREHYIRYLETHDKKILLGAPNTFVYFSFTGFIKNKLSCEKQLPILKRKNDEPIPCPCGPYGGLFMSVKAFKKAYSPNELLYLYFDDTEFTFRLVDQNIKLWLAPQARIFDIDKSWGNKKLSHKFSNQYFETDELRIKYFFRNRVYLEKKYFVTKKHVYVFNMVIYMAILGVKAVLSGSIPRYRVIWKSVIDGWNFDKLNVTH
ncbi:glycosyltransferase [Acerihabitans sp. TG2]|uniref:glycosyltransferase family 2 protein n=1 Tax=Acerihabitans sp. TG2 TaxID=3096008 RepID=UPI002B2361B1|nr:glycosyltransferase [Acerihabitans sp. TG2]MEA9389299.1 glycosyltransferase [Acerihabitans sp. TG2]